MAEAIDMHGFVREINEALILATLRDATRHGYQIALDVDTHTGGKFKFHHGTLYPILHRLEKDGRIQGEWSTAEGRKRKEYRLTPVGRRNLTELAQRVHGVLQTLDSTLGGAA